MKDFILFIRNTGNPIVELSPQEQQGHIQKVGAFIMGLVEKDIMKAAHPFEMDGVILSYQNGDFIEEKVDESKEMISGYYHIVAKNLEEVMEIAKSDPRFEDGVWRMEIRPIMKIGGINE
jgi:hypothetical protein